MSSQLEQVTSQLADLRQRLEKPPPATVPSSESTNDVDPPEHFGATYDHSALPENVNGAIFNAPDPTSATDDMFGLRTSRIGDLSPARLDTTDVTSEQIYDLFSL